MNIVSKALLIFTLSMAACHKPSANTNGVAATGDYMVVGWTGGFGGFSVHTYYLIANGKVMKDVARWNTLPEDLNQFSFTQDTRASLYDSVKELLSTIPAELLRRNNGEIGENKGADMGFTDIRTRIRGVNYRWGFNMDQSASSAEVQAFYNKAQRVFQ